MFPALYPLRYVAVAGVILAAVGAFYWHAYREGEKHAVQKQEQHDAAAKDSANSIREHDRGVDPKRLLENDPFLRR